MDTKTDRFRQTGAGLMDVLVAVLVLTIGFIGISALMARSMVDSNSAVAHTQSTVATYSVLDILRVHREAARNGDYNTTATVTYHTPPALPTCSLSPTLSGDAQTLVLGWCQGHGGPPPSGLAALGDGATGQIACNANGVCEITIVFDDSRATGGMTHQTFKTKAAL